jgi:hypothetical protein
MTSTQKTLAFGCILGLAGAGAALVFVRYQQRMNAYYGEGPQPIAVAALAQRGLEGKHWVELTNVRLGPRAVVDAKRGSIDAVWIPVFPLGTAERTPIHAVLRSTKSHSLEDFALRLRDRTTYRGAIHAPAAGDSALRTQLAATYPGYPLPQQIWEVDIDFGGPRYARWTSAIHSASGGLLVFGVICLLGFVGGCFGAKEPLTAPSFDSVPELRY